MFSIIEDLGKIEFIFMTIIQLQKKLISLSVIDYHRHKKINDYQISKENLVYFKDSIYQTYKDTMYYSNISDLLTYNLERNINNNLAQFNINLIEILSNYLNIDLKYDLSSKINITNKKIFNLRYT